MEINEKPIRIEVGGGTITSNTLVVGLIQTALVQHGFGNVEAVHPEGDTDMGEAVNATTSLLDVIRHTYPQIFATPVIVKQNLSRANPASDSAPKEIALETLSKAFVYGQWIREDDAH